MCAPDHYAIKYEINPWMNVSNGIDAALARRQWHALYRILKRLGVQVVLVPQGKNLPDMVFTANAGVVDGKTFIPSHFRYPQRQGESAAFTGFFKKKHYRVDDAARGLYFEGEGDILPYRNLLFGGYRYRSERGAHEKVSAHLGKRLVALELATPHFYHLDTCLFPLDENTVLYYPGAFSAKGRAAIKQAVKNPVAVDKPDAFRFACNAFRVGKKVVVNHVSRGFKDRLKKLGYETVETPTSEFVKAGGSVKCLLLKL